jgi:DNA-binding transcriptional LysR family regulator
VRRDHPQVRDRLTLKQYTTMHHVLVAPRGRAGGAADQVLATLGEQRRVTRALPYFLAALHCVSESDCVATISVRLARTHAERFGLQIFKPPIDLPPYDIDQIWHPRVEADPAHIWLRRLVASVARGIAKM